MSITDTLKIGKAALITTFIAIALNPISIFLGYYLSKQLAEPNIQIEYVNITPSKMKLIISSELHEKLNNNPDILKNIKYKFLFDQFSSKTEPDPSSFLHLLSQNQVNREISRDLAVAILQYHQDTISLFNTKLEALSHNINIFEQQKNISLKMLRPALSLNLWKLVKDFNEGSTDSLEILKYYKHRIANERKIYLKLYNEIDDFHKNNWKTRTGEVKYEIGLINHGDTDGVIYPEGILSIHNKKIIINIENNEYIVLGPHSFNSITFFVNKEKNTISSLNDLKEIITKSLPIKHSITINASLNDITQDLVLPVN